MYGYGYTIVSATAMKQGNQKCSAGDWPMGPDSNVGDPRICPTPCIPPKKSEFKEIYFKGYYNRSELILNVEPAIISK
jgi:hypothetical protein